METLQEADYQPSDSLEDYYYQMPSADPARYTPSRRVKSHDRKKGIKLPDIEPDDTISDDPHDDIGIAKLAQPREEKVKKQEKQEWWQDMNDYYGVQDYWSTSSSPFK